MVYKLLILIFFLGIKIGYTNVIYDKNEIVITEIELNNYKELYKNNFGTDISNNIAIKNIVLIMKTIRFLKINNQPNDLVMIRRRRKQTWNSLVNILKKKLDRSAL